MHTTYTVNIHEAKTQLSRLVIRASQGDEIVIARAGMPVAKLGPIAPEKISKRSGVLKGRIKIAKDFDAPLPDDILDTFEGR